MTLGALFLTSWAIGFSGAVTPGPLLVACITQAARGGFGAGVLTAVGHALVEFGLVVSLTLGLGAVLGRPDTAFSISLAGGLVLLWMGWTTFVPAWRGRVYLPGTEHTPNRGVDRGVDDGVSIRPRAGGERVRALVAGVAGTVSGPFWIIWWASVGLSYLGLAAPLGGAGVASFYVGHVMADMVWYTAVAAAVAGGRRVLTIRGYRGLLMACGIVLGGLGLLFAGRGVSAVLNWVS